MTPSNRLPIADIAERLRSLAAEWSGTEANERAAFEPRLIGFSVTRQPDILTLMGEVTRDSLGHYAAARKVA